VNGFLSELQWQPTIGDPTFMGWLTVAAYAAGSGLAVMTAIAYRDSYVDRAAHLQVSKLWFAVAVLMASLCVNKQLDLQSLLTDIGRIIARHQQWYERRREFQKLFVLGAIFGSALLGCLIAWRHHTFWRQHKLLFAGLLFLLTFIVVRAISFHHVEEMLDWHAFGLRMNWALELGGIFLVGLAARRELAALTINTCSSS
jgi:hypothetical protein